MDGKASKKSDREREGKMFPALFWCTLPKALDNKLMISCELYRNLQVKTHQIYSWRKEKQPFGRLKRRSINFRCLYLASLIHMKFLRRCVIKK